MKIKLLALAAMTLAACGQPAPAAPQLTPDEQYAELVRCWRANVGYVEFLASHNQFDGPLERHRVALEAQAREVGATLGKTEVDMDADLALSLPGYRGRFIDPHSPIYAAEGLPGPTSFAQDEIDHCQLRNVTD